MTSTSGLERPIQYKGTGTLYVQYTIEYRYKVVPSVWASEGFPHYILMVEHLHGQCGKLPRFFILFPPPPFSWRRTGCGSCEMGRKWAGRICSDSDGCKMGLKSIVNRHRRSTFRTWTLPRSQEDAT